MQKITLSGNLGGDPEMRKLQSGDSLLSFSLGANRKVKGESQTTWYRCSIFGKRAEVLQPMLHKGKRVFVMGELTAKLNDHNGKTYLNLDVRVDEIDVGAREDGGSGQHDGGGQAPQQQQRRAPAQQQSAAPPEEGDGGRYAGDDDIPF